MLKVTQTTSGRDDIQTKTIGTKFNWLGKPGWGNDEHRDTSILCMVVCGRHCFFFQGLLEGKYLGLKSDRNNCDLQQ